MVVMSAWCSCLHVSTVSVVLKSVGCLCPRSAYICRAMVFPWCICMRCCSRLRAADFSMALMLMLMSSWCSLATQTSQLQ